MALYLGMFDLGGSGKGACFLSVHSGEYSFPDTVRIASEFSVAIANKRVKSGHGSIDCGTRSRVHLRYVVVQCLCVATLCWNHAHPHISEQVLLRAIEALHTLSDGRNKITVKKVKKHYADVYNEFNSALLGGRSSINSSSLQSTGTRSSAGTKNANANAVENNLSTLLLANPRSSRSDTRLSATSHETSIAIGSAAALGGSGRSGEGVKHAIRVHAIDGAIATRCVNDFALFPSSEIFPAATAASKGTAKRASKRQITQKEQDHLEIQHEQQRCAMRRTMADFGNGFLVEGAQFDTNSDNESDSRGGEGEGAKETLAVSNSVLVGEQSSEPVETPSTNGSDSRSIHSFSFGDAMQQHQQQQQQQPQQGDATWSPFVPEMEMNDDGHDGRDDGAVWDPFATSKLSLTPTEAVAEAERIQDIRSNGLEATAHFEQESEETAKRITDDFGNSCKSKGARSSSRNLQDDGTTESTKLRNESTDPMSTCGKVYALIEEEIRYVTCSDDASQRQQQQHDHDHDHQQQRVKHQGKIVLRAQRYAFAPAVNPPSFKADSVVVLVSLSLEKSGQPSSAPSSASLSSLSPALTGAEASASAAAAAAEKAQAQTTEATEAAVDGNLTLRTNASVAIADGHSGVVHCNVPVHMRDDDTDIDTTSTPGAASSAVASTVRPSAASLVTAAFFRVSESVCLAAKARVGRVVCDAKVMRADADGSALVLLRAVIRSNPANTVPLENITLKLSMKPLLRLLSDGRSSAVLVRYASQLQMPATWEQSTGILQCVLDKCTPGEESTVLIRISLAGALQATQGQQYTVACQCRVTLQGVLVSGLSAAVKLGQEEPNTITLLTRLRTVVVLPSQQQPLVERSSTGRWNLPTSYQKVPR